MDETAAYHIAHGAGIAKGVKMERERILNIISIYIMNSAESGLDTHQLEVVETLIKNDIDEAIALIKGEING